MVTVQTSLYYRRLLEQNGKRLKYRDISPVGLDEANAYTVFCPWRVPCGKGLGSIDEEEPS